MLINAISIVACFQMLVGFINDGLSKMLISRAATHFGLVSGIPVITAYLFVTFQLGNMHPSYYKHHTLRPFQVIFALFVMDAFMYFMHRMEHITKSSFHQVHHKYSIPEWHNAYDASVIDTCVMILLPLHLTTHLFHLSLSEYIWFGTLLSFWLTLIHSNRTFWFEKYLNRMGLCSPKFHRKHHMCRNVNYGHIFVIWDFVFGTGKW